MSTPEDGSAATQDSAILHSKQFPIFTGHDSSLPSNDSPQREGDTTRTRLFGRHCHLSTMRNLNLINIVPTRNPRDRYTECT
ncbi:hypothetical protein SAMN04487819_101191 [Actinopolyspora alba]|uniref:Uncharacterized protein n=1 Tax=Actinopolyspora alba TaxID=673379 RepID=A0A1I1TM92_9ACTN|nr:hypothetical protein SAMN04487819_101191 [Actinopolyspora alba]